MAENRYMGFTRVISPLFITGDGPYLAGIIKWEPFDKKPIFE